MQLYRGSIEHLPAGFGELMNRLPGGEVLHRSTKLDPAQVHEQVESWGRDIYADLTAYAKQRGLAIVRCWNRVPFIHARSRDGLDAYMYFNRGRHAGFATAGVDTYPAATGVGSLDGQLHVTALLAGAEAIPLENPDQIPAWQYSENYGPTPPSFSRATRIVIEDTSILLVSGTASVLGEDTAHADAPLRQAEETLRLLRSLCDAPPTSVPLSWDTLRYAQIYCPDEAVRDQLQPAARDWFPSHCEVTWDPAPICRTNLHLEIECGFWPDGE